MLLLMMTMMSLFLLLHNLLVLHSNLLLRVHVVGPGARAGSGRALASGEVLELARAGLQPEEGGDLTQDGVGLLEAGDPARQGVLVPATGHAHGIHRALLHCQRHIEHNMLQLAVQENYQHTISINY